MKNCSFQLDSSMAAEMKRRAIVLSRKRGRTMTVSSILRELCEMFLDATTPAPEPPMAVTFQTNYF